MCGIAGFYGFRNDELIKKISKQLEHRGPDGQGFFTNDQVTLLNRRLAIIDRKGGDQPIFNEDKSVVVTYNGEIYNYRELRNFLEKKNHHFKTQSDTEVIVHGYEEWGENSFNRYNGMFAIALYDSKQGKLILARDHFGIKPLYYAFTLGAFRMIFASEIKPILDSGLVVKKPNDRVIYRYLRFRIHDDRRETFFEGIQRLMPGEMVIIQNGKLKLKKFSNLEEELLESSRHALPVGGQGRTMKTSEVEEFKKRLIEAVKLRLISEVPVGTCLSGGLDSSTVVSIVNRLLAKRVSEAQSVGKIQNTFSAVFPGESNDEERYIDEVVRNIKIKSHKVYPKPEEFFKEMDEFVRIQEEPTISTGPYAQYKVMQEAHKHVTVVLDGQGSDEMMAGYLPYYFVYLRQLKKEKSYFKLLIEFWSSRDILSKYFLQKLITYVGLKKKVDPDVLLNVNFVRKFSNESFYSTQAHLKNRLIEDIFRNSLPSLLRYEDKNSMRFSIEGRVPFLDFTLLRYLFALPDDAIIKNGWNKYILRKSVKDLLPDSILARRNKIGFTTPEYKWFIRMKNKIYSLFLSESFTRRKYFKQKEVLKAFQMFIEGKVEDTMVFWRLLNLEIWLRLFFDTKQDNSTNSKDYRLGTPNRGKNLKIQVDGKEYLRYPIQTDLYKKGDKVSEKISNDASKALSSLSMKNLRKKKWFLVVSEKIVAIAQGRSYFIWDIKPTIFARLLAHFVIKTPYGIGLGSEWTMQLAIEEAGLPRILIATTVAAVTRPFGIKGMFYRIAGRGVSSIDGPTEYSLYPSNVSAKLGPQDPQKVTEQITKDIRNKLSVSVIPKSFRDPISNKQMLNQVQHDKNKILNNFLGVVLIDANDLGQKVLGNSTNLPNSIAEKVFSDNPMGQADEQTPIVVVFTS